MTKEEKRELKALKNDVQIFEKCKKSCMGSDEDECSSEAVKQII